MTMAEMSRMMESFNMRCTFRQLRTALASIVVSLLAIECVAGCSSGSGEAKAPPPPLATTRPNFTDIIPQSPGALVTHLDVYQLAVSRGAISLNADFWKRVDEERIDPATKDLLLKNGVRVGIAPESDWDYFKDILERNNARAQWGSVMAGESGSIELTMKKGIGTEDIFYLNDRDQLFGRTYEKCDNLLGVGFWPDPRKINELHVTISPTVRATRTRLEFKYNGDQREIVEVRPEYLYDLNLQTVIPTESFLIMAPSPQAKWPTSLGSAFLLLDGNADQKEQILVLVPRSMRRPTANPAPKNPAVTTQP